MSFESVMPSNHLILCRPLLLPLSIFLSIRVFSNESALRIRWPNIGVSASASVLPMNIQDRFLLGWTGCISLQSKELLRVFWTPQFKSINSSANSHSRAEIWVLIIRCGGKEVSGLVIIFKEIPSMQPSTWGLVYLIGKRMEVQYSIQS